MNPLRVNNEPGEETRWLVHNVLTFVADALEAFDQGSVSFNEGAMRGASLVIKVCIDALKEVEE